MYCVEHKANNYVIFLYDDITRLIMMIILKCKEIPKSLFCVTGTNIVL